MPMILQNEVQMYNYKNLDKYNHRGRNYGAPSPSRSQKRKIKDSTVSSNTSQIFFKL